MYLILRRERKESGRRKTGKLREKGGRLWEKHKYRERAVCAACILQTKSDLLSSDGQNG